MSNDQTEYNILGCSIRVKSNENNDTKAAKAVEIVMNEIEKMRSSNPSLKDCDIADLSALNVATKYLDKDNEFKESIFTLKAGVEGALKFVEEVSPGSLQNSSVSSGQ